MSFTLKRHYPIKVEYWASEDAVKQPVQLTSNVLINLGANTSNRLNWRVSTTVTFSAKSEEREIAHGSVVFVGYFEIPDTIKVEEREKFVAANGASVLYSATRELIANITCRSTNRHLILPLAVFNDVKIAPNSKTENIEAQV